MSNEDPHPRDWTIGTVQAHKTSWLIAYMTDPEPIIKPFREELEEVLHSARIDRNARSIDLEDEMKTVCMRIVTWVVEELDRRIPVPA